MREPFGDQLGAPWSVEFNTRRASARRFLPPAVATTIFLVLLVSSTWTKTRRVPSRDQEG